jgi:hypothetical protein
MDFECSDMFTFPRIKRDLILATYPRDISSSTRRALRKQDPLTLLGCKAFPQNIIGRNQEATTNADIDSDEVNLGWKKVGKGFEDWKKSEVKEMYEEVSPSFSTKILRRDDFTGKYTLLDSTINNGMRSSFLFPMKDTGEYISIEDAEQMSKDLDLVEGLALPKSYNTGFDMRSDESFSRIFFYSLGAPLIAVQKKDDPAVVPELGPFVVDMPLEGLKSRPLYRSLGARIHFGEDQIVTAIYDYAKKKQLKPGDDGWDAAKTLAKTTAFLLVTAREHLIWCHLVVSNTITTTSILELSPSHPIRRLLTVFTYNATGVNQDAFDTLVTDTGMLHRSTGIEYESLRDVFEMSYKQCKMYQPFTEHELSPEVAKLAEEGKFPYVTEGREYWNIVHKFVSEWIGAAGDAAEDEQAMAFYKSVQESTKGQAYELPDYTSTEDMIKLITQSIFTVTAHHELVGCVVDYIKQPDRAGFRILKKNNGTDTDTQSWLLASLIGAATSVRMPKLMKPFKKFFGAGDAPAWERDVWNSFIGNLGEQSTKVREADAKRDVEFKYFDPENFECSVSV